MSAEKKKQNKSNITQSRSRAMIAVSSMSMFHRSENVSDGVSEDGEPENDADVGRISGNDGRPAPSHPQYSPLLDFVAGVQTSPGRAS